MQKRFWVEPASLIFLISCWSLSWDFFEKLMEKCWNIWTRRPVFLNFDFTAEFFCLKIIDLSRKNLKRDPRLPKVPILFDLVRSLLVSCKSTRTLIGCSFPRKELLGKFCLQCLKKLFMRKPLLKKNSFCSSWSIHSFIYLKAFWAMFIWVAVLFSENSQFCCFTDVNLMYILLIFSQSSSINPIKLISIIVIFFLREYISLIRIIKTKLVENKFLLVPEKKSNKKTRSMNWSRSLFEIFSRV